MTVVVEVPRSVRPEVGILTPASRQTDVLGFDVAVDDGALVRADTAQDVAQNMEREAHRAWAHQHVGQGAFTQLGDEDVLTFDGFRRLQAHDVGVIQQGGDAGLVREDVVPGGVAMCEHLERDVHALDRVGGSYLSRSARGAASRCGTVHLVPRRRRGSGGGRRERRERAIACNYGARAPASCSEGFERCEAERRARASSIRRAPDAPSF